MAIIRSDELAKDVPGAEALVSRNKEHKSEIDAHQEAFTKFTLTGQALIANGHFLSEEVSWWFFRVLAHFQVPGLNINANFHWWSRDSYLNFY